MTQEQVIQLVTEVLGETPSAVKLLTFGHNSVSFDVTLSERALILRTNKNPSVFARTAHNLSVLRHLGLPVPHIVASDLSQAHYPMAYMMLGKIPGRDLRFELGTMTGAQKESLAEKIVGFQRRVATLPPGRGFGYAPIGERAAFSSWQDLITSEIRRDLPADPDPPLAGWLERVFGLMDRFAPYLGRVSPTPFLDDLTTKNVVVERGELRGLIDFDVICYGDPLWTLGLTATAIVADVGAEHLDYVDALCHAYGLDEASRKVVDLYAALFALTFWVRASSAETARLSRALEGWLGPLEHQ